MDIVYSGIIGPDPSGCEVTLVDNGTDWGARINAADVALGAKAGAICCQGGGNIASQIILNTGASSLRTLRFGPGTWTNSISAGNVETILMHDHCLLEGKSMTETIIQEPPNANLTRAVLVNPWAASALGDGAAQVNDLSIRNIQFSGVGIPGSINGITGTVITGLLNGGTFENIWFNKVHAIGLNIGQSNNHQFVNPCRNIMVRGCKFTNVGGGVPPNYSGGGGVSLAVVSGDHITIDNCTFIDALGNAAIDLEPNTLFDPITNITISNCFVSQEGTTGNVEPGCFGIVMHTAGASAGTFTPSNSGGSLATGTYFVVVAFVNANGTWPYTIQSLPLSITGPNGSIAVSWSAPPPTPPLGITSYNVYYTAADGGAGNETRYINTAGLSATITTTTIGGGVSSGTPPSIVGPISIIGNTLRAGYQVDGGGSGDVFGAFLISGALYINYGSSAGQSYKVTAENNYVMSSFVIDNANDNTIRNNTFILPSGDSAVIGYRNVIDNNTVETVSRQGAYVFGITEYGASDHTTLSNNKVTKASTIVGAHSVISGETVISRPVWTTAYPMLTTGNVTTTNANDLLVAILNSPGGNLLPLIQSPFTALQTTNEPTLSVFVPGYRAVTSTGTYAGTCLVEAYYAPYTAAILALKGAASLVQQTDAGAMSLQPPTATPSTSGGSLSTNTYYYRVAGIYHGGEWLAPEISVAVIGPTGSVALSWYVGTPQTSFPSYKIYRGTAAGVYTTFYTSATNSFTDTGAAGTAGSPPAALAFTGTLGSTPTNTNGLVLTYCYAAMTPTKLNISSIFGGGVTWAKGPEAINPWGIASIWHGENVQSAPSGVMTVTLDGNTLASQDRIWFNVGEWSGVVTTNAVDGQATNSFPLTW